MIVLRMVGFLFLLALGVSFSLYLASRQRRYLSFAFGLIKFGVVLALAVAVLYLLERLVLIV